MVPFSSVVPVVDEPQVIPQEDGGVLLQLSSQHNLPERKFDLNNFDQNLAEALTEDELIEWGKELRSSIEDDKDSQSVYFEGVAKIINLLGHQILSDGSKDDLPFKGSAQIYDTTLGETALDILSTATSYLYPSSGMVDFVVIGESSPELEAQAQRKKAYFNNYLTHVAKEYRKESQKTLYWAILTGSCYKKVYIDPTLGRPTAKFIRPSDFIINKNFSTHHTAPRKTHIVHLNERELFILQKKGYYRDIDISPIQNYGNESSDIQEQINQITGNQEEYGESKVKIYDLYECYEERIFKEDPFCPRFDGRDGEPEEMPMQYITTLDSESGKVLSIYRNWDPHDILKKKREYFVNYSFLPALEGEGSGLVNGGGRLAEAATSILRQLINTSLYSNFPGGVYDSSVRVENNNIRPAPGEFIPLQTGGRPIEQVITALPYKEPSGSLATILQDIQGRIRKPAAMVDQPLMDFAQRAPMGTVLFMLETMQRVPNAIIENFYISFGEELNLFNDRFAEWIPDNQSYPFKVRGGQNVIMKQDFMNDVSVVPAADPSLPNTNYKFLLSELILNQAKEGAAYHNVRYAYEYFYKSMGLCDEDISQLLIPLPQEAPSVDPITENQNLLTGKPVKVYPYQDHDAHITIHSLIQADPSSPPQVQQAALAHIQEHKAQKFLVDMQNQIGMQLPSDPSQLSPEAQNQIAVAAAHIAQQQLEQLQQQQSKNNQSIDPAMVGVMEVEAQKENALRKDALLEQKQRQDFEIEQRRLALEEKKILVDANVKERDIALREQEHHLKVNNIQLKEIQNASS